MLAATLSSTRWVLLDASQRRTAFLEAALEELGLANGSVIRGRAEEVARRPDLRHVFDAVVARGFGPPSLTAECAAGFLAVGGRLVVSEPPDGASDRWPGEALAGLGLAVGARTGSPAHFQVLHAQEVCSERYPRRAPHKRPLF
ncbi:MAG: rRNA (guanine527-N7)-methyltransferase [Acidimicrobiaceae bacterium]|nr:rRNA (guanine527-N7)-methyltransferase [Acidimicrobiaceae bacterium]